MNEIFSHLLKLEESLPPFVGFTSRVDAYYRLEQNNKSSYWFGGRLFPHYLVPNQPCPIVKWTSEKQMMKFIERKRKELQE